MPPTSASPPVAGRNLPSFLLLSLCVADTVAFLFAFWGRNAAGLGRHDAGLALALSFMVPLTLYASLGLAFVAALMMLLAWYRRRTLWVSLAAFVVALLPSLVLLGVDFL